MWLLLDSLGGVLQDSLEGEWLEAVALSSVEFTLELHPKIEIHIRSQNRTEFFPL